MVSPEPFEVSSNHGFSSNDNGHFRVLPRWLSLPTSLAALTAGGGAQISSCNLPQDREDSVTFIDEWWDNFQHNSRVVSALTSPNLYVSAISSSSIEGTLLLLLRRPTFENELSLFWLFKDRSVEPSVHCRGSKLGWKAVGNYPMVNEEQAIFKRFSLRPSPLKTCNILIIYLSVFTPNDKQFSTLQNLPTCQSGTPAQPNLSPNIFALCFAQSPFSFVDNASSCLYAISAAECV